MIEDDSSKQLFEKVNELRKAEFESTNEILAYENEGNDLADFNRDI